MPFADQVEEVECREEEQAELSDCQLRNIEQDEDADPGEHQGSAYDEIVLGASAGDSVAVGGRAPRGTSPLHESPQQEIDHEGAEHGDEIPEVIQRRGEPRLP